MRESAPFYRLVEKGLFLPSCHLASNDSAILLGKWLLLFEWQTVVLPSQQRTERSGPDLHLANGQPLAE